MSNELPKIGTYHLTVDPFNVDFTGHLTIGMLGNQLLNCAGFHANERGFGISRLNEEDYTWVLSRMAIEFDDLPMEYQHFTVNTWIESVMRLFTGRNFEIQDQLGRTIGHAKTMWAMINVQTRKPADLLSIGDGGIVKWIHTEKECPIDGPSRIKVAADQPSDTIRVKYSDIDINGHLNSVRYIEHILNLFDLSYYKSHCIRRFEIAYIAECLFGDELALYQSCDDGDTFSVEIRKTASNEVVCRSKIWFKERI